MDEMEVKQKILSNCKQDSNGCLVWQGALSGNGYASITVNQIRYSGHRLILKFKNGIWPNQTDHLCRNRACLNEEHLEDVSYSTNNKRMWQHRFRASKCKAGHPLEGTNLIIRKDGARVCKMCKSIDQNIRRSIARNK